MTVLVTGGFGLVGRSVVQSLLEAGHRIRLFDRAQAVVPRRLLARLSGALRRKTRQALSRIEFRKGDICNIADVGRAAKGVDAVVHLAAMIPPAADRNPENADYVNRGGTMNLVRACEDERAPIRFVFSSSIAVYGDRLSDPQIRLTDTPKPEIHDTYAVQKLAAEQIVTESSLNWSIFRLTAIASPDKLGLDPLLFEMPLRTPIEWCTARDAGRALARAVEHPELNGRILHLAGGARCRATFREYLDEMLDIMGLGRGFLPDEAFGPGPFHCGFMDAGPAQEVLRFQSESLDDYYAQVKRRVAIRRPLFRILRPLIRAYLVSRSPHWRKYRNRNPARARRRVRFGWIFAGNQGRQML